jgi:hypothetical protein
MEYVMANEFGNLGTLSPEDYAQQQQINRQQKMAEMLMQNNQQPQGQMIGNHYVAPSFFQNILPLVNMYQGQRLAEKADTKAAQLAEAIRGRNATETQDIIQTLQGTSDYKPAVPYPTKPVISESSDLGPQSYPAIENQVGQAPNQQAALMKALKSSSPIGQMVAGTLINKSLEGPKEFNLGAEEVRYRINPDGTTTEIASGKGKIEKPPVSYQEYQLAKQEGFKGSYNDYQTLDANRKRSVTNVTTNVMPEQKTFENTQKLRQNFAQEPIYKGFQEVKSAYSQINDGLNLKSPAGDLAAATKFMKILDPGSVVRESELTMAMKATGALDRLQNYAQNVVKGTKLTPTQRDDFRKLSTDFYNSSATQYNSKQNEYVDIAKRYNLNPQDVTSAPIKLEATSNTQYAVNPKTNERIMSNDGGKTWS